MAIDYASLVQVKEGSDGEISPSGTVDLTSVQPVETEGDKTAFEQFRKEEAPVQQKSYKTEITPTEFPDIKGKFPRHEALNSMLLSAEGAAWNLIIKPVIGKEGYENIGGQDIDKYLADMEKKHPIASVIGGTAPYIASAFLFPESLLPHVYGRLAVQFGTIGFLSGTGKVSTTEADKTFREKVDVVSKDVLEQIAYAPIFAKAQLLKFVDKPFETALAKAGVIGSGTATMSTFFGNNVVEAVKQGGILAALSLFLEIPSLAKTAMGRGVCSRAVNQASSGSVLSDIKLDPDSPNFKEQLSVVSQMLTEQVNASWNKITGGKKSVVISAAVKLPNGKEIDDFNHESALNKVNMTKDVHVEGRDYQAGFRMVDIEGNSKFITRKEAMDIFGKDRSEDFEGLNQGKYMSKPDEPKIVNPLTLEKIEQENEKRGINALKAWVSKRYETKPFVKEMEENFQILRGAQQADEIEMRNVLKKAKFDSKDVEQAYHFDENKGELLTPEQQRIYDDYVKPLKQEYSSLYAELRNKGIPLPDEGYTPRFAKDKGNIFDWIKAKTEKLSGGKGLLGKTSGAFKKRTMKILVDKDGNRIVVNIDNGKVIAFNKGKSTAFGKLKIETNQQILDKELKPLEIQARKLEKEQDILMATKSRYLASESRINGIHVRLSELYDQIADIYAKHTHGDVNLNGKRFVDNTGKPWIIGEATTKEIESHTNVRYHKNVVLNYMTRVNELRKIKRAISFLEGIKENPIFKEFATNQYSPIERKGYKSIFLPQFKGWRAEKRIADALNNFNDKMYRDENPYEIYSAVNSLLRNAIFFNPAIHIPNIGVHWLVNRGTMKWAMPSQYVKLFQTGSRAWEAVKTQNVDYQDMLRSGVNLLYHGQSGETLIDLMAKKMGEEIKSKPELAKQLAINLGTKINPYVISGKATWFVNDLAIMQAIYEDMSNGMSKADAISNVGKHIPNYVIPSRIMDSRAIGKLMGDSNITMFGAYHYGALKSYGEMIKSLLGKVPMRERADAADKLAMLGITMFFIYPQADKFARWIMGDESAHFRRAGATTFPENISKLSKNEMDFAQFIQSVLTPSVGFRTLTELILNKDWLTGKKIFHHGQYIEGLQQVATTSVAPLAATTRIKEGKMTIKEWIGSLGGISVSNPTTGRLYNMMDDKADMMADIDKLMLTNPREAKEMRDRFNIRQVKDLKEIADKEGITQIPHSVLTQFIITTEQVKKKEKKTPKKILKGEKSPKRRKVDSSEWTRIMP